MFRWLRLRREPAAAVPPGSRRETGARIEAAVADWLNGQGCKELARNFQVRGGELDLVIDDGGVVAFVEVRYRLHGGIEAALESVGRLKQRRLIHAAQRYLQQQPKLRTRPCRFDVVAVEGSDGDFRFRWIKDGFRIDD